MQVERSEFVSADELAAALGVSKWSLYQLAAKDKLPIKSLRVGTRFRWSRKAMERWQRELEGNLSVGLDTNSETRTT